MCGIVGLVRRGHHEALKHDIAAMCDAIVHRGPDDSGHVVLGAAALGMRRLSIIDVTGGHQPIPNEDESAWIVFNGEIYNHHQLRGQLEARGHRFRTRSDTEVILHGYEEWGDDVAGRLRGMFGFAIWDVRRGRLFAARDQLGIKPLYYWPQDEGVAIASELRSFLALENFPRDICEEAVISYLALGYVPQPLSIFRAARKLAPGTLLSWTQETGPVLRIYWNPLTIDENSDIGEAEAVNRLRVLLAEAVESHLESEVPLGAFLSGGIDSTTVVALMCRASTNKVRTFSIGFEEDAFNEAAHAESVARALGTEHASLTLRPDAELLINRVVQIYDEPFADPSALPTWLLSALAREHVTVSLSGDGGDELFAGYTRYSSTAGGILPGPLRTLSARMGRVLPHFFPGRNRLIDLGRPRQARFNACVVTPLSLDEGGVVLPQAAREHSVDGWFGDVWGGTIRRDFVTQMTLVDLAYYLPGDILTKLDRASMAVSLEARVPLLHLPLVEFALALPAALKLRDGATKYVFRRAIDGLVPPQVLAYPKRGFAVPLGRWLRNELRPLLDEVHALSDDFPGVFDAGAIRRLVREHLLRRRDQSWQLWRLLVLRRWITHLRAGDLAHAVERFKSSELLLRSTATPQPSSRGEAQGFSKERT